VKQYVGGGSGSRGPLRPGTRARQVELGGDLRHVDDVVGGRVGVEAVARKGLVGPGPAAGLVGGLEHDDALPGSGEVAGGDEAVVASADDEDGRGGGRGHGVLLRMLKAVPEGGAPG